MIKEDLIIAENNIKDKKVKFKKGILNEKDKRSIALRRAEELKDRIGDYLEAREEIKTGFNQQEQIQIQKAKILSLLGGTQEDWNNWHWQMANRINDVDTLSKILCLSDSEKEQMEEVGKRYRWAVSPYYLSLMDPEDPTCPIRLQTLPSVLEMVDTGGKADPMGEEYTSPAPCITRRYPDRLIINVTNQCAMYCRHCQRRRNIGEVDRNRSRKDLKAALKYIKDNPEVRDVLITGGDSFMLSTDTLDWLLTELDKIPHVEIKRLGTRTLVTVPQRVTDELCAVIEKHPPIYINTQFNHPKEVTPEVRDACSKLIKAGAVLGNQAVLLNSINNDAHVMKKLCHELLRVRIRPYYIFHAKPVMGTAHFMTRVEEGLEIMEKLRGYTSGLAIPTYIINAPKGYGKTPMLPEYLISQGKDSLTIRTWEKKIMDVPNVQWADPNQFSEY